MSPPIIPSGSTPGSLGPYNLTNGTGVRFDVVLSLTYQNTYAATTPWGTTEDCRLASWAQHLSVGGDDYDIITAAYWNIATPDQILLTALRHLAIASANYWTGGTDGGREAAIFPVVWPLYPQIITEVTTLPVVSSRLSGVCAAIGLPSLTQLASPALFSTWMPRYFGEAPIA